MREYLRTASLVIPLILLPFTFITVFAQNAVLGDFLYGYKRGLENGILVAASLSLPLTVKVTAKGLRKRGLGEESFLLPLLSRVRKKITPADEVLQLFKKAGKGEKAIKALANKYGLFAK